MLGVNIASAAANKNMTPAELGMDLGVSRRTVMKWAKGYAVPDLEMLKRISKHLGVGPAKLLDRKVQTDEEIQAALDEYAAAAAKKSFKWEILRGILITVIGLFPMISQLLNLYYSKNGGEPTGFFAKFYNGNFDASILFISVIILFIGLWGLTGHLRKKK